MAVRLAPCSPSETGISGSILLSSRPHCKCFFRGCRKLSQEGFDPIEDYFRVSLQEQVDPAGSRCFLRIDLDHSSPMPLGLENQVRCRENHCRGPNGEKEVTSGGSLCLLDNMGIDSLTKPDHTRPQAPSTVGTYWRKRRKWNSFIPPTVRGCHTFLPAADIP